MTNGVRQLIRIVTIMIMPNPVQGDREASSALSPVLEAKAKSKPASVAQAEPAAAPLAKAEPAEALVTKAKPAEALEAKAEPAEKLEAKANCLAARMLASEAPDLHKRDQTEPPDLNVWIGKQVKKLPAQGSEDDVWKQTA